MNNRKVEFKVGVFVLLGLVLAGAMVMRFSKGTGLSRTYDIHLRASNASGIIPGAGVFMSGVPVGSVTEIDLAPDGSSVTMLASIYSDFKIASNAVFMITTVGFLGDRYVSVSPGPRESRKIGFLKPGDYVDVMEAFDFSAVAETANGLMARLSGTVDQLSNTVVKLNSTVLSGQSLSNLTGAVANFRSFSDQLVTGASNINGIVQSNSTPISHSISNLHGFSERLVRLTDDLGEVVATNRAELAAAMKNVKSATERADQLLAGVEQGKGLAGTLLKSEEMAADTARMMSNFTAFSSNLNQRGLWGILWKPKPTREKPPR